MPMPQPYCFRLLEWDVEGVIAKMIKTAQDQRLPNLPPADFERLPEKGCILFL
jgi:hypothetical protein